MSDTSQNGWPLISSPSRTARVVIPGTGRHLILTPDPAGLVLAHLALWFHETIERLDRGVWDEWGWAYRPVRGSSAVWSNHASGTAIDLNATRHPMGTEPLETLTPAQVARIRRRLRRRYRGLVVWGGEWSRPDPMHFELSDDPHAIRRLAGELAQTPRGRRIRKANR